MSYFQGDQWKKTTLKTALLFPGVLFAIFFALNMLVWGQKSSGAVPFGTLFALCFLWFGISTPLVFVGSYFGYKKPAPEDPVRTNKIPRQIPDQARVPTVPIDVTCSSMKLVQFSWPAAFICKACLHVLLAAAG